MNQSQKIIDSSSWKELRVRNHDPRVSIGRGTYGDPQLILYSADDRIEIGRYCSIAGATRIMGGGEHNYRATSTFPFYWFHGEDPEAEAGDPMKIRFRNAVRSGVTRIGSDVWIGYGATILPGVSIGHGAVIGASAVVASDVPPFAIMVGNPGRCVKKRFDDDSIERLLAIHWWDWKPEYIYQYQDALCSAPEKFLEIIDALSSAALSAMYEPNPLGIDGAYKPSHRLLIPINRVAKRIVPPIIYSALSRLTR